ncbi:uncharacterized protein METZ01_LOCUS91262 [marine metagenome]|uniref:Uncharacterized protein n=1 Tax=marine metagenome TaxID=408172 RepID=A0A381VF69_9ZZZZ
MPCNEDHLVNTSVNRDCLAKMIRFRKEAKHLAVLIF